MLRFLYLSIDLLAVIIPLLLSFEKKIYFYEKWKYAFKAIAFTTPVFLVWDLLFTYYGVWGFTDQYTLGIKVINLPLEEFLLFFTVPFTCIFFYEIIYFNWRDKFKSGFFYQISLCLGLFLFLFGFYHYDKIYTCISCVSSSVLLGYHCARKKQMNHEVFWVAFVIILIPLGLINLIQEGSITREPLKWYNENAILGIRILTIPAENIVYILLLILANVTLYKRFIKQSLVIE